MIRKVMNPAFSPNSLKEFEPAVSEYVDQFVGALKILSERDGGLVNMDEWFFNLMLSVRPEMIRLTADNRISHHWK